MRWHSWGDISNDLHLEFAYYLRFGSVFPRHHLSLILCCRSGIDMNETEQTAHERRWGISTQGKRSPEGHHRHVTVKLQKCATCLSSRRASHG